MGTKSVEGNEDENVYRGSISSVAPSRVTAAVGVTNNLGDFNSVRIDFRFEENVPEDVEPLDFANTLYAKAEGLLEEKLAEYETE